MLLAELEIRHSRAVVPTRRVALGIHWLPVEPPPGPGGVLLGGLVAAHVDAIDDELLLDLLGLIDDLEGDRRLPQPRLRHRFQTDVVGLDRSRHKLVAVGEEMVFELDDHGPAIPQVLGAVYAVRTMPDDAQPVVFDALRRALRWDGAIGPELVTYLRDRRGLGLPWRGLPTDIRWALRVLGFAAETEPEGDDVRRRFRSPLREVHPDHGAVAEGLPALGLALISYPLHPPGRPERARTEHLPALDVPCLFVSGTRDAFGTVDELTAATKAVPGPVTHVWIEGGDHGLKKRDDEVADAVREWVASLR